MQLQAIYDIAALCHNHGLRQVVMCPGSRCAPLTLAFARHGGFDVRTFSDERSAAFIALGMARETKTPVVLLCTSGTAVYNFAPAIAEAYFSNIPLLILTADRPQEWIGQQDGQAIFQHNIFGGHVKHCFLLPQHYDHYDDRWAINRMVNEALNLTKHDPAGPVHVNLPFREPFYPKKDESIKFSADVRTIIEKEEPPVLSESHLENLAKDWSNYHHILLVSGQQDPDEALRLALRKFAENKSIPILADITANLHDNDNVMLHADTFLGQASEEVKKSLQPDLLITFGKGLVAKQVKLFLRRYKAAAHWHIQAAGRVADTFQQLTKIIRTTPADFMSKFASIQQGDDFNGQRQKNYFKLWEIEEGKTRRSLEKFFPQDELGEFELVKEIIKSLPGDCNVHLANSMSVRYANFIGLDSTQNKVSVFCNRGTSGIDGCTSSAVGHSLVSTKMNVLITGDLAFFYDRNAFWHNYSLSNFRIVLLNNHGGVIFKMIDDPADLDEADEFFVTRQTLNAQKTAEEFGFEYLKLDHRRKMKNLLKDFFEESKVPKILEIETTSGTSKSIFEKFKSHIRKNYEL